MVLDTRLLKSILTNSFIHCRCIAYVFNLMIVAGLKIVKEHIKKIKKINKNNSKINKNT